MMIMGAEGLSAMALSRALWIPDLYFLSPGLSVLQEHLLTPGPQPLHQATDLPEEFLKTQIAGS